MGSCLFQKCIRVMEVSENSPDKFWRPAEFLQLPLELVG